MTPLGEEKQKLLRMNADDSASIHSFASSSSTLAASPVSPTEEKDFSSLSVLEDPEQAHTPIFATPPPLQHSWRQTPLTPRGISHLILRVGSILLPSYLQPRDPSTPHVPRKIHPTSYLDGLRGVAALVVSLSHFILNWFYPLRNGYLSSPTDTSILQLPIIRLLFAGRASVSIFFVISGFVLSYKPLSLIRSTSNQSSAVLTTLSSSVFRRSIRLYVTIIFGTFISAILAWKGCYLPTPARNEITVIY